eukprot:3372002-Pyramimonas_sp.AAC.1
MGAHPDMDVTLRPIASAVQNDNSNVFLQVSVDFHIIVFTKRMQHWKAHKCHPHDKDSECSRIKDQL